MKYYYLTHNGLNKKEVGVYPQSTTAKINGNIHETKDSNKWILPEIILEKKAKYTTLISAVTIIEIEYLTVKINFIEFLKQFNIIDYLYRNIKVYHNNALIPDYCIFRLTYNSEESVIDFDRSVFIISDGIIFSKKVNELITFKNYSQYIIERKKIFDTPGLYLKPHEVYLDFSVMDEDMLRFEFMPFHGPGYYISEKLKNAIEVQHFTGMAFQEIEKVHPNFRAVFKT